MSMLSKEKINFKSLEEKTFKALILKVNSIGGIIGI